MDSDVVVCECEYCYRKFRIQKDHIFGKPPQHCSIECKQNILKRQPSAECKSQTNKAIDSEIKRFVSAYIDNVDIDALKELYGHLKYRKYLKMVPIELRNRGRC